MPLAILALTAVAGLYAALADGYAPFILALVALTTVVVIGLPALEECSAVERVDRLAELRDPELWCLCVLGVLIYSFS